MIGQLISVEDDVSMVLPGSVGGVSGLEFMQAILDGTNPGPPIGQTMGYALHSV